MLYEVGARRIGGYLRGPAGADAAARRGFVEALCATVRATTPPPSKKALCAAGGGITGVYYELGVLKCLEDTLDGFSVHDFDLFFGISAGAIVTSLVANRIALDELLVDWIRRGAASSTSSCACATSRCATCRNRVACVGEQLRDYRDRVRSGDERFRWTEALGQLAALAGPFFSAEAKFRQLAALFTAPGRTDDFRALPRELYIGATDQDSREHVLFGAEPYRHVPISRAVQASAAIHPFLSSVEIDGRRYTDGFVTARPTSPPPSSAAPT
ncbi:MAG: patatin-like phospholipase family protein [Myxococcales bacterium]|nr:patatin-like phospholipase family protein [Myxococcales bacterium]